jgi:hypothetical protein
MKMARETMNSTERVSAAIRLEKPDRVPIVPLLTPDPAGHLAGLTMAQVSSSNQVAMNAILKVFDEYGGWDSQYGGPIIPIQFQAANLYPMKMRIPGKDLTDDEMFQLVEEEILRPEDYDKICEDLDAFYYADYLWRITDLKPEDLPKEIEALWTAGIEFVRECANRDIQPLFQGYALHPFFTLSLMRSMVPFTQDLYYNPEPVERTLRRMTTELIPKQIGIVKGSGINACLLTEERASAFFYPLSVFDRFWWPYTQEIVDAFWSEGIVSIFHLDTCWDKNIPYFKKLPKGSAVVGLDSSTDIFRAKEVLRGHLCLYGDVSATLLSIGKPEDVEAYCKKLIDEVGGDGGFILGTGCCVPPNCKPENFKAMIETGKNYEFSKK